jgi:hypothetical protein
VQAKNLPLKALLVLDNAPAHPPGLEEDLTGEYSFIQVRFLPPNTTPLIQPMDQQVISNLKKLYTKALFQRCFEVTSDTELTLRDFWKNHFNILHCLRIIDKAWDEVSLRTLKSSWRNLWPDCVALKDLEDTATEDVVVNEIVSLGKSMGLDVDSDDVEELIEDHRNELTTEELQELQREQQEVIEDVSSEEEENISTKEIKELCHHWENIEHIVQKWHPNTAVANRSVNLFNDNVMEHFRRILKKRQKQSTLDIFLNCKGPKRQKKESREKSSNIFTIESDEEL